MAMEGYSRRNNSERDIQPVAITSVNTQTRKAMVLTRVKTDIEVDCSYSTGETLVTPAVGEQWYIERFDNVWRLYGKIPFNDPTLLIEPEEGQVSVGSGTGPLELNGSEIRVNNTLRLGTTHFSINDDGKLQYSINGGTTWIPVVPPAGAGAPDSTDEVPEGTTNLYFTAPRAAAAAPVQSVSGKTGIVTLAKADVGLGNVDNTTDNAKPISSATATALSSKADLVSGLVPSTQLPQPRVIQFDTFVDLPTIGQINTLYITDDVGNLYRWNGSTYDLLISGAGVLSNTDELPEGTTNLYFTDARASAAAPVQDDDPRLTDERTPTDNTVDTDKLVDESVTLDKLAPDVQDALAASPYDVSYPQTFGQRAVGYGQNTIGIKLARPVTFTQIIYRCATADNSGSLVVELRKNGTLVTGTSATIASTSQVTGSSLTGSWSFADGDILTVYITAIGGSPIGLGLVADLKGNA